MAADLPKLVRVDVRHNGLSEQAVAEARPRRHRVAVSGTEPSTASKPPVLGA